jgi:hypothetical protein
MKIKILFLKKINLNKTLTLITTIIMVINLILCILKNLKKIWNIKKKIIIQMNMHIIYLKWNR